MRHWHCQRPRCTLRFSDPDETCEYMMKKNEIRRLIDIDYDHNYYGYILWHFWIKSRKGSLLVFSFFNVSSVVSTPSQQSPGREGSENIFSPLFWVNVCRCRGICLVSTRKLISLCLLKEIRLLAVWRRTLIAPGLSQSESVIMDVPEVVWGRNVFTALYKNVACFCQSVSEWYIEMFVWNTFGRDMEWFNMATLYI